jgi:hypothetical protein
VIKPCNHPWFRDDCGSRFNKIVNIARVFGEPGQVIFHEGDKEITCSPRTGGDEITVPEAGASASDG